MPDSKSFRAPLIAMFGVMIAGVAFAGPANADAAYPPPAGTKVIATGAGSQALAATASVPVKAAVVAGTSGLAFTGTNAIGVAGLGGLLVVGGAGLVLAGKRRKVNE